MSKVIKLVNKGRSSGDFILLADHYINTTQTRYSGPSSLVDDSEYLTEVEPIMRYAINAFVEEL